MNNLSHSVNKVYKTNELSQFKTIKGNRPPNPQHVRRLADSIKANGVLQNPILVNENFEVIDGQHRLLAAKNVESEIYFIIVPNYNMEEVHVLNLNQKNWTSKDFMEGYAEMGIDSYIKLKNFYNKNKVFNLSDCIILCANKSSFNETIRQKYDKRLPNIIVNRKEVFEEGTWVGGDFNLAQEWADKLKLVKQFYSGYNKSSFIRTMIGLFKNENFDFFEFLNKLKIQQERMVDCTNIEQYKLLIEDIYNYRRREKVNLRY